MRIWTKTGDDGTTGLLYGGRVRKDAERVEAYGAVDEAVAAIGVARAQLSGPRADLLLRIQRELFVVGAELATAPENHRKLSAEKGTKVTSPMIDGLEAILTQLEAQVVMPKGFVIPGNAPGSAALDLARAIVRRAERGAVRIELPDGEVVRYLNRLADLLWILARLEEPTTTPLHEA